MDPQPANPGVEANSEPNDSNEKEKVENTSRTSILRVDQIYNKKDRKFVLVKTVRSTPKQISSKYVLVVRRNIDQKGMCTSVLLEIRGKSLRSELAAIYKDAEGPRLNESPPVLEPRLLYHAAEKLQVRCQKEESKPWRDEDLVYELHAALTYFYEEFQFESENIKTLTQKREITFSTLWAILPPNELVFTLDALGEPRVYRAISHELRQNQDCSYYLAIVCGFVDDDGDRIGNASSREIDLQAFAASKKVADLPIFPLRFHPEKDRIIDELTTRGKKRLQLRGRQFVEYHGHGLHEKLLPSGQTRVQRFNSHGRVIIDPLVFGQLHPQNSFIPYIEKGIPVEDLTRDQILTLPSILYGFSLGDKIWGGFALKRIADIEWDASIFDYLVLSEERKHLIRTLVQAHVAQTTTFDDFVKDKGKGIIGLLTGPPGVGKTLTAEAVAEIVERPLYMLSSGELGDEPHTMEKNLTEVLELTQTWGCVLLLDEADVFLTKRDDTNLTRNAVVSIFLRQLEYYQGILILTTNRVESIDPAFQSRIHFCHNYPELNHAARRTIWAEFAQRAGQTSNLEIAISERGKDELAELPMNGRQIKNTMKMAQSMATEEGKALTVKGIKLVSDSLQGFAFKDGSSA